MAMIRVEPVQVRVRTDWFDGRPERSPGATERLPVTRLTAVREEAAAYPGHHRAADAVRGRDAPRAARADLPAPVAPLDDHGLDEERAAA